jgi:hypothetical protein
MKFNRAWTEKISLIILAASGLVGCFYWFEYRPAQIKHECSWVHIEQDRYGHDYWREADEDEYKFCLHDNGL